MRKYLIYLLLCLPVTYAAGQNTQTLTGERNAYRAADQLTKQQVEYRDPGSKGRGLFWDFSMLQAINEEYSLNYSIPDSTDMTRLCGLEHRTRYYYRQQNDSLWATGFENASTYMEYPVQELKLRFPFSYGDTLFSRFEGTGQYCHRIALKVKGYTRVMADAEGDLLLPQRETVKKALRVRTLRHYTETGKDSVEMTLDTYAWYAKGIHYPVFESIRTTQSKKGSRKDELGESMKDTTVFTTSFYYPPELQLGQVQTDSIPGSPPSGVLEGAAAIFTEASWQPNPVAENLNLTYKLTRNALIWFTVHNNAGIPLCTTSPASMIAGPNNTTIYMGGLIPGVYTLYVHVDDMILRMNVIKN